MFISKIKYISAIVFCGIFLTACKTDFVAETYTTDMFSDKNLIIPVKMDVEISSCTSDGIEEDKTKILSIFSNISNAKVIDCKKVDMDSFLTISFDASMTSEKASHHDMIIHRVVLEKQSNTRNIGVFFNPNFVMRVKQLFENSYQTFDPSKVTVRLSVNNDARNESITISSYDIWVNDEPYAEFNKEMSTREKLLLQLSDVQTALAVKSEVVYVFSITQE